MNPDFVNQNGEPMTDDERRAWVDQICAEQSEKGAKFFWFETHLTIPNLIMVQGWKAEPDWGALPEPEWGLAAA